MLSRRISVLFFRIVICLFFALAETATVRILAWSSGPPPATTIQPDGVYSAFFTSHPKCSSGSNIHNTRKCGGICCSLRVYPAEWEDRGSVNAAYTAALQQMLRQIRLAIERRHPGFEAEGTNMTDTERATIIAFEVIFPEKAQIVCFFFTCAKRCGRRQERRDCRQPTQKTLIWP